MKILMVTSEAVPFAKSGGLADVVTALAHNIKLKGHDAKIIMPLYGFIDSSSFDFFPWKIKIHIGDDHYIRTAKIVEKDVEFIFVDHESFSSRIGIYGETGNMPYADNSFRFTLFTYAVFEVCRRLSWYPDIFHCHDWPTGLLPLMLKRKTNRLFSAAKSMMTIHNLGYQGIFPKHDMHFTQLPADDFSLGLLTGEKRNLQNINFLAVGLAYCDSITTVSETYSKEIQESHYGEGLHLLLHARKDVLTGIINGVDYTEWNPETDTLLPLHYSSNAQANKSELKTILQQHFKLPIDNSIPIIGIVSRLADQKGFRELCGGDNSALERILRDFAIQFVIVGTGEEELETALTSISERYDNIAVSITFNNYLAHLIEAGSDFFLMPSRYEPCGLNQTYSLRYGTIPIVRKTGGLADTVAQFSENFNEGTGIVFDSMSGEAIYDAVENAVHIWEGSTDVQKSEIRKRCMDKRFSWEKSTEKYISLYSKLFTLGGPHE